MNLDRKTRLQRRGLLKAALAALCPISSAAFPVVANSDSIGSLYISGARESANQHVAVVFDEQANLLASVPLQARAHGAAAHAKSHRACIFGRRPGFFMNTFDIRTPQNQRVVSPVDGRHFYGHGAYSDNGQLLYATENDYDNARGVLGIYDTARHYKRIGELNSHGVGPHEVIKIPNSSLLVIANGGIQTHPDSGREKLNLPTMESSLSIIDTRNEKLVARHVLADDLHQVSIRHLAYTDNGELWYAGQYEGDDLPVKGLAGMISIEKSIQSFKNGLSRSGLVMIDIPEHVQDRVAGYLTSLAIVGQHAVYTAARGGYVFFVNRRTQLIDDSLSVFDCSGVAATSIGTDTFTHDGALITSGTGEIVSVGNEGATSIALHNLQWDNHVYRV